MKRKSSETENAVLKDGTQKSAGPSKDIKKKKKLANESAPPEKQAKKSKFEKPTEIKKADKSTAQKAVPQFGKKVQRDGKKGNIVQVADGEKPNWLELKKEKKELREKRKEKRLADVYGLSVKAKMIGEKLRRVNCSTEEREKLSKKLYELLKGNLHRAIFTHDLSRVIQWLLKYCNPEIRENVMTELKPSFLQMLQSKYAKNCIMKGLKYGSASTRNDIITSCYGHVVKLVSHSVSSPVIDYAYTNFATDLNKIHFRQEFYGDMYKHAKDDKVKTISDVYASASDLKSATLSAVKINLLRILNKKLFTSPIVQTVIADYLKVCSSEDRAEIIVMLRSSIVELSHSENGAKAGTICIWHGTTKDRKLSLKSLKGHVKDLCISEHGHIVLMAIFDSVDDTVFVKKSILSEILSDVVEIASNEYGRRVILYLVARRDTAHFHPALIEDLKQGDGNATSKKSAEIREGELVEAAIEPLLDSIAQDATSWLANSSIAVVTLAILKRGQGEKLKSAFEAVANFICDEESRVKEDNGEERAPVEHSGLHMTLKKLVLTDKTFGEKEMTTFGEILETRLDNEMIERWINFNRGCFLLVSLLENSVESVVSSLKNKLEGFASALKKKKGAGASILLKKIKK